MTALARYDQACRAIADALRVDEIVQIRDELELRMRATRRLGQIIARQKQTVGLNGGALRRGSESEPRDERPTLADNGIKKRLSMQAQKLAAVAETEFEGLIQTWRDESQALDG